MAPSIVRVFVASFLFYFASAKIYSHALSPARTKSFVVGAASKSPSSRRLHGIRQSAPQQPVTRLRAGETCDEQISRGEVHHFAVELGAGQYADVTFEWLGMNLGIAVIDPGGRKVLPTDAVLSSNGPLSISILADRAGVYRLDVTPIVRPKIQGKYQVRLGEPRLPTNEDRSRLEAQTRLSQAQGALLSRNFEGYAEAIALYGAAHDANGAARAWMLGGDAYKEARDLANAKASYEKAAAIWKLSGYHRGEAYAVISLGALERSSGSLNAAVEYYKQAEMLFAQISDLRGQADALYGQSFTLMVLNQPVLAIPLLERVIQIRQSYGDVIGESSALNMMGDAHRIIGEADKSAGFYDRAEKNLTGLEHRSLEVAITANKALIDQDQGFWELAVTEYRQSLKIFEIILEQPVPAACASAPSAKDAPVCRSAAAVLDNLGQTYTTLGLFEQSAEQLQSALSIWEALKNPSGQGLTMLHIGNAKFLQGRLDAAFADYQTALKLLPPDNESAIALANTYLGLIHTTRDEPGRALAYYRDALPLQRATGDRLTLAITLDNLGMAYQLTGDTAEAMAHLSEALTIWRKIKDPDGEALTLYHRAIVEAATSDLSAANRSSEQALKLLESFRTRLRAERSRIAYLATKQDYYKLDIDLKMRLGTVSASDSYVAAAIESSEKARARVLLDELSEAKIFSGIVATSLEPQLTTLGEQRAALDRLLETKTEARFRLSEDFTEPIGRIDKDIATIRAKAAQIDAEIKFTSPRFDALSRPQPASSRQIQQQLDPDTVLLEYSLGEERSYVWAVTSNSIEGFQLPARSQIEAAANQITKSLADRNRTVNGETGAQYERRRGQAEKDFDAASAELSDLVIRPLPPLLRTKRLVIVADGALQRVSFAALPLPRAGPQPQRRLIEDHEIVYEPSASVLALQRSEVANRQPAPRAVAILADPVFNKDDARVASALARLNPPRNGSNSNGGVGGENATNKREVSRALEDIGLGLFPRLYSSASEAKRIISVAPKGENKEALNFDASRETATSAALSSYRIVHFATHAVVDYEHPELSGIVLSLVDRKGQPQDGFLRLHDIYNLNLSADLVVLSACQTGIGKEIKGEGLIALTRGFMYAGAQRVVASLWKVDDAATSNLMAEFYRQMFVNGQRPAAALRAAQLSFAKKHSPADWAGFVLQGEWK